jgi:hypothetical protein
MPSVKFCRIKAPASRASFSAKSRCVVYGLMLISEYPRAQGPRRHLS